VPTDIVILHLQKLGTGILKSKRAPLQQATPTILKAEKQTSLLGVIHSTNDPSVQHVLVALGSLEQTNPNHCKAIAKGYPGCWIQVGWITGQDATCTGSGTTGTAIDVFVEIFDDSGSPCLEGNFGAATSDASYDARYYSLVGSLHRYQAYYQPNNSSTIQVLAYGDFTDQKTAELAWGEVRAPTDVTAPHCPVLGQNTIGNWNFVGNTASNSFASEVQLYTGSWADWTTSVANPTQQQP
jgi:hypothetical protein